PRSRDAARPPSVLSLSRNQTAPSCARRGGPHGRPSAFGRSAACLSVACIHLSTSPSGIHHMRHTILAAALATALGSTSFTAAAQSAQEREVSELKAQIMALAAKVEELETRTDAQSDINVATQENL